MDSLREIFDAMNSRIRSPIFGSIAVMFIIINWKPLFYLAFADASAVEKFQFFDDNTTNWSNFIWPVGVGLAFALASPWIALFSSWAADVPTKRRKIRQTKSADTILTEKLRLEQTRIQFLATEESALIEAAKRDEEVREIRSKDIRQKLESEIDEMRSINARLENGEPIPIPEKTKRIESYYLVEIGRLTNKLNNIIARFNENYSESDRKNIEDLTSRIRELHMNLNEHILSTN